MVFSLFLPWRKIGWHWGFGAAGFGMAFGVIQFVRSRGLLGSAGAAPNSIDEAKRSKLVLRTKISLVVMVAVILSGLFGIYTVDARAFAESFYYFLCFVAGTYFLYLYFFAGLSSAEKRTLCCCHCFLLVLRHSGLALINPQAL